MRSCCKILYRKWTGKKLYYVCHVCKYEIDIGEVIFYETLKKITELDIQR